MSERSEEAHQGPASNHQDNPRSGDAQPAVHREDETLSRITRTVERGIAPSGWTDFDPSDQSLFESLDGLGQPFALESRDELRRTAELEGAFARFPSQDDPPEQSLRDAVDPFELIDLRINADAQQAPQKDDAQKSAQDAIRVALGERDAQVCVRAPWAAFIQELREETRLEGDLQLRASYVFLVANLMRLHAAQAPEAGVLADKLHVAAAQLPGGMRASLVDRVMQNWAQAGPDFVDAIEHLERWDNHRDPQGAGRRRASIALERLLVGGLDASRAEPLQALLCAPDTLAGLVFRAVRAQQQGAQVKAAQLWGRAAPYLRGEPRQVLADASAYFIRDLPAFFGRMQRARGEAHSRAQLLMMQRRAALSGDHRAEARALYELVVADIALGKRAQRASASATASTGQSAWQQRLKGLTAARLFRLSTLLHKFKASGKPAEGALAGVSAYRVLHDAVSLAPQNWVYLRRLVRRSRQRGDLHTCAKSLRTLARDYPNPRLAALAATELARTIYLSAGRQPEQKLRSVERYLREALASDPECAPARLALRRLGLAAEAEAPPADEAAYLAAQDWEGLARRLAQKLGEAVEPEVWSSLAFRIAQLQAWHLSPIADSRLRAESLEQVLVGTPDALAALVELLDVRLARREYPAALGLLETLAELAEDPENPENPEERAAWLAERAELLEYHMGQPAQGARVLQQVLRAQPASADAFLGLLRGDVFLSDLQVEQHVIPAIVARLDAGVSVHESEALAVELMLRAEACDAARRTLDARFSGHPLWQFIRLCTSVTTDADGNPRFSLDALGALKRMWMAPRAMELLEVFERALADPEATAQPPSSYGLKRRLAAIGIDAEQEGQVLRAMDDARRLHDPESFGLVAALGARRSRDFIGRESHLLWMAISFVWRGQDAPALKICEHILARFPDYMPALKLAKILGPRLGRWAEVARWCELEARRTRVERVGFESRLMASEVQQNYLGDFDAACQQFRTLLQQDPRHPQAFEELKELLLQRGEIPEVLEIFEQRLTLFLPAEERIALLNEMGKIALYRANDTQAAARYFGRSLELDRHQLRILRVIGELHHEVGDFEAAIRAYRDAVALSEHTVLIERLLLGIAALHEAAGQPAEALNAYQEAFAIDSDRVHILIDIARLQMQCGAEAHALESLATLIAHEKEEVNAAQTEVLREALSRRAQCLLRLERPREEVEAAYQALLDAYPQAFDDAEDFCEYMRAHGSDDEIVAFFDRLAARAFLEMKGRPFAAHFKLARRLGHVERAFNLAAVAQALGYASTTMRRYHEVESAQRRWPLAPLPEGIVEELTPAAMTPAFLGLLRRSEPALARACAGTDALPAAPSQSSALNPQDPTLPPGLRRALDWPALFGLELRDAREYAPTEAHPALAGGSLLVEDNGLRLYLDTRWRDADDPTALLVHLGQQLAAWSLGIGRWQFLDLRTCFLAVSRVVDCYAPGWGSAAEPDTDGIDLERLQQWVQAAEIPELAVHALDVSSRMSVQGVATEFKLVELTVERAACVLLDDPARFLPHTKYLGSEHGMLQQPWSFLFTEIAAHIRQQVGVACP